MKNIFDIPKILWIALLGGDILFGFWGHKEFVKRGFSDPLVMELVILVGLNILLLIVRAYFPKLWKFLTTEDVPSK